MTRGRSGVPDCCPAAIAAIGSPQTNTHISTGKEYDVYALSVYQGVVSLQIVNDLNMISWLPAWFFGVCDSSMPSDWICSLPAEDLQMVLGPHFVAADEAAYHRMVELDSESVAAFERRLDANAKHGD